MKTTIFPFVLLCTLLSFSFSYDWNWHQFIENKNITAFTHSHRDWRESFYAIKGHGIISTTQSMPEITDTSISDALKSTTALAMNPTSKVLYAGTSKGLYSFNTQKDNSTWEYIAQTEQISITKMITYAKDAQDMLYALTSDKKLYRYANEELTQIDPASIIKTTIDSFKIEDIDTYPIEEYEHQPWIIVSYFKNDSVTTAKLILTPEKNFIDTIHVSSVSQKPHEFLYVLDCHQISTGNFICYAKNNLCTIQFDSLNTPILKLSQEETVTDLALFPRDYHCYNQRSYFTDALLLTTTMGSYAFRLTTIYEIGTDTIDVHSDGDESLFTFFPLPAQSIAYAGDHDDDELYVLNDEGIATVEIELLVPTLHDITIKQPNTFTKVNNHIKLTKEFAHSGTITITNLKGQTLKQQSISEIQNRSISIANLAKGVYLLKLQTESGVLTEKIRVE